MASTAAAGEHRGIAWRYDPNTDLMFATEDLAKLHGLEPDIPGAITMGRLCDAYRYPGGEKLEIAVRQAVKNGSAFDIVAPLGGGDAEDAAVVRIAGEASDERPGVQGEALNVTAEERQAHDRWRAGGFDAATRLPNRFLFEDRLQMALAQGERGASGLAVVMLSVAERNGARSAIDALMANVSVQLRSLLRANDTVARVASGTFALLLPGATEIARVVPPLERLRAQADPGGKGEAARLSMACGVAMYPGAGDTASELFAAADRALVRAMRGGMNSAAPFAWNLASR